MVSRKVTLNRWLVGTAAVGCFIASASIALAAPRETFWWGGLLRAGIVLVALWFCLPTRNRPAAWADVSPLGAAILLGTLLIAIVRPRVGLPLLIVVLFVQWLFSLRHKPPVKRRPRHPAELFADDR
jgi:hypothetical protein